MTKRQEIKKAIEMFNRHTDRGECLDCPAIFRLLHEYQALLSPDREPWEVAYRKSRNIPNEVPIRDERGRLFFNYLDATDYRDGYLARDAEKQEGSK